MAELDENNVSATSPELINDAVAMTELLSFPANTPSSSAKSACDPPSTSARQLLKDRLFIGNLHPTVDE